MKIGKASVALAAATFASFAISLPAHATTTASDRDKDGIACEAA